MDTLGIVEMIAIEERGASIISAWDSVSKIQLDLLVLKLVKKLAMLLHGSMKIYLK